MRLHRHVRALTTAIVLAGVSMLTSGTPPAAAARPCTSGPELRYLVLFTPGGPAEAAEREVDDNCGRLTGYYADIGVGIAESDDPGFSQRIGTDRAYSAEQEARRRAATDNQILDFQPERARPPRADEQWNMAAIRAGRARDVTQGDDDVVVGVLDSGVDATHPELAESVDPELSADCLAGVPRSPARSWRPGESGHGTHVAGVIAAADDGIGVTGVAPDVRVAPIRVVDDAGYAHPEYAVCGFVWAAQHGIRVANTSFLVKSAQLGCGSRTGSPVPREAVRRAVEYATSRGVLTVAAVGNQRVDMSSLYGRQRSNCDAVPADLDGALAVSSVGQNDLKAGYSSYGLGAVDLAAPGGESDPPGQCVRSTIPGGYGTACGTSMAAPHVSGVAALAATRHPDATPEELARLLTTRAQPMRCPDDYDLNADSVQDALCLGYASYNGFYGHGMVDALNAVAPDTAPFGSALREGRVAHR